MTIRRRHVPLRRCVACRASLPKADLVRLMRDEGGWRIDQSGRGGGRGTWVCRDCLGRLDERPIVRALNRTFRHDATHVRALLRSLRPTAAPDSLDSRHGGTHG